MYEMFLRNLFQFSIRIQTDSLLKILVFIIKEFKNCDGTKRERR